MKQGQLLLVIDEEPFRLALDQAKLRLAEAGGVAHEGPAVAGA